MKTRQMEQISQDEENEIISYGIYRLKTDILTLLLVSIIGFLSGALFIYLVFFASFSLLRHYAGGYHADSEEKCWVISVVLLLFVAVSLKIYDRYMLITNVGCILSTAIILLLSPVENKNRRLEYEEKRAYRVIVRTILLLELLMIFVFSGIQMIDISVAMMHGILLAGGLVLVGAIKENMNSENHFTKKT